MDELRALFPGEQSHKSEAMRAFSVSTMHGWNIYARFTVHDNLDLQTEDKLGVNGHSLHRVWDRLERSSFPDEVDVD
jgi:hypothetical protein